MKLKGIIIALTMVPCLVACDRYEYVPYDAGWDPQQTLAIKAWYELVSDCSRAVEFTDIFDRYRAVREDREAALELVRKHITPYDLYFDRMTAGNGARVELNLNDGLYYSSFSHSYQCIYVNIHSKYKAEPDGDRWAFTAVPDSGDPDRSDFGKYGFSMSFGGMVADGTVEVSDLSIKYWKWDERYSLTITTPEGSVLRSPLCTASKGHKYYPVDGTLVIDYRPERKPYTFEFDYEMPSAMTLTLTFHDGTFTIDDGQGYVKDFPSTPFLFASNDY